MESGHEYLPQRAVFHGFVPLVMGTKLDLLAVGVEEKAALALWDSMLEDAEALHGMLNRFDPRSEVSRLNSACDSGPVAVSEGLLELIGLCERFRELSGGLFDVTRGSCGEGSIICGGGFVDLRGGSVDFGGVAKGYFLSRCRSLLLSEGVGCSYVDFGGSSILAMGHHPFGDSWKISLTNPFAANGVATFDLVDCALSVSGNQPGYTGHIVNPLTGEQVERKCLCAVLAPDPLAAEVASTAAIAGGRGCIDSLKAGLGVSEISYFSL